MNFKIEKGCELFDRMRELKGKMKSANKAAWDLVESIGFTQFRSRSFGSIAGGISSFYADTKPEGFRYTYTSDSPNDFFPKRTKANKELLAKIEALPIVDEKALNSLLNYDGRDVNEDAYNGKGGKYMSFHPGIMFNKNEVLISVADYVNYKPVEGMIEITITEYRKLEKKK